MAINLNLCELKQKCFKYLANITSKYFSNDKINMLTEIAFTNLMKHALSQESIDTNTLQEYEQILINYFENKLNEYLNELFKKISVNQLQISAIPFEQSPNPVIEKFVEQLKIRDNEEWLPKFLLKTKMVQRNMRKNATAC